MTEVGFTKREPKTVAATVGSAPARRIHANQENTNQEDGGFTRSEELWTVVV